jgi:hypothetical protein
MDIEYLMTTTRSARKSLDPDSRSRMGIVSALCSAFFLTGLIASNKDLVRSGGRMRWVANPQSSGREHS